MEHKFIVATDAVLYSSHTFPVSSKESVQCSLDIFPLICLDGRKQILLKGAFAET